MKPDLEAGWDDQPIPYAILAIIAIFVVFVAGGWMLVLLFFLLLGAAHLLITALALTHDALMGDYE